MKGNRSLLLSSLATVGIFATGATDPAEARELPDPSRDLNRLLGVIKPQTGESPWREIAWMTDVTEARKRAVAENKPLVIFTAADGSPLGRT